MGKVTIAKNMGAGRYMVTLNYDLAPLEPELFEIAAADAEHAALLSSAIDTRDALRQAVDDAAVAMDAVILQWQEALISATQPDPPPFPPPPDPETTPDGGQESGLFAAINAARGDAGASEMGRSPALDLAARSLLAVLSGTQRTTDTRSSPPQRAVQAGYTSDSAVGVGQALAFGAPTPERAIAQWRSRPGALASVLSSGYTECGVAARYARGNPYGYLWCVMLSAPGESATYTPRTIPDPGANH